MTLYEAISARKSIRKYKKDGIPDTLCRQIEIFARSASVLDQQIPYKIRILDNTKGGVKVRGLLKAEAPYFLVLYSEEKKGYGINAGYIMEQIVLYLTVKGLGCCYLGGTLVDKQEPGMKQAVVVSFGYPEGTVLYRDKTIAKRHSLKDLCVFKEEIEEPVKIILKAARLAPSSLNAQPWRFLVYHDRICVFACKDKIKMPIFQSMRDVNMGIALSHIMLAAEELWLDIKLVNEEALKKKGYKNGEYLVTAVLQ